MSRLLQALKNLESRPAPPAAVGPASRLSTVEKGLLAHLADQPHTPSPDPPAGTHADPSDACRPSPIKPLTADNPLDYLSAGVPIIALDRGPALPIPPVTPATMAPELAPPRTLDLVPSTSPAFVPPPPIPASTAPEPLAPKPSPPIMPAPAEPPLRRTARKTDLPPPAVLSRQATLLERSIRRTLAEQEQSEPFRQLADRLKADLDQVGGRSILITGVGPASETHDVILGAAAVLAEAGEPIVVIDADGIRRSLTNQLELTDGTGLAELARGEQPDTDPICATVFHNLYVLPMGKVRLPDVGAVANRLASLVQSLEEEFRLVILDGGRTSDRAAAPLARLCDATYFVVHLGDTESSQAQRALRDFRATGARLLGCIATS